VGELKECARGDRERVVGVERTRERCECKEEMRGEEGNVFVDSKIQRMMN
jgi:hypothetical protein